MLRKSAERRTLLGYCGLFLLALLVRILVILSFGLEKIEFGDALDYLKSAELLCLEGDYRGKTGMPFFRAPGLPAYISLVTTCAPLQHIPLIKFSLAIVDSLNAVLIGILASLLWRRRSVGLFAGFAAALYPFFALQVRDIQTEPLFLCFELIFLVALLLGMRLGKFRYFALAGFSLALATLTRPVTLVAIPMIALCLVFFGRRERYAALTFVLAAIFALSFWTYSNFKKYGEIIAVNDAFGYNLWRGTSEELFQVYQRKDAKTFAEAAARFELETEQGIVRKVLETGGTPKELSAIWTEIAAREIREHPWSFVNKLLWNAWVFWRPWLNPLVYSSKIVWASGAVVTLLYGCALVGFRRLYREEFRVAFLLLAYCLLIWIAHIPFQVVARFRIPVIDPIFIAVAAGVVWPLLRRSKQDL